MDFEQVSQRRTLLLLVDRSTGFEHILYFDDRDHYPENASERLLLFLHAMNPIEYEPYIIKIRAEEYS